jgi:hypothetical protein
MFDLDLEDEEGTLMDQFWQLRDEDVSSSFIRPGNETY